MRQHLFSPLFLLFPLTRHKVLFLRGYTLKRTVIKAGAEPQNKDVEAQAAVSPAADAAADAARDDEATIEASAPSAENEKAENASTA